MMGPLRLQYLPMSPHDRPMISGLRRRGIDRPSGRCLRILVSVIGPVTVAAGVWVTLGAGQLEGQLNATAGQSVELANRVVVACADTQNPSADLRGACRQASAVRAEPIPRSTTVVPVPVIGPGAVPIPGAPPARYTMTVGGDLYACTRTGGSDTSPAYTCTAEEG